MLYQRSKKIVNTYFASIQDIQEQFAKLSNIKT